LNEKEKEIIDSIAKKVVSSDLQPFFQLVLYTMKPLIFIGGELARFFLAPFLGLLDEKGYEILDTFEKKENVDILLSRIEELSKTT